MIKKLIKRWLARPSRSPAPGQRTEIPATEHGIDPSRVDRRALEVVDTLQRAGFEAYVVGGAVRDLLLGITPKDFDVATNATPEEVKRLFRRAFIIGRRFRIVHVVYGRGREHEVIEVSTFRALLDAANAKRMSGNERSHKRQLEQVSHAVDASGRVLRDNVWGPQNEDAARRDFTINAMYYDPRSGVVVDYHGGFADAKAKQIRMIGDAALRYREDPVRVLRAVRFAAKLAALGFTLAPATRRPLKACTSLLADLPPSRLFDEMMKLLQTGHAMASVQTLEQLGLSKGLFALLDHVVSRADHPMVTGVLQDTDRRVAAGKPVAPSYLLACVLWPDVLLARDALGAAGRRLAPLEALSAAADDVFQSRVGDVSGRGKLGADMREVWLMQPRLERRLPRSIDGLLAQPRFRAGFDFLRLRAQCGEVDIDCAAWWEAMSQATNAHERDLLMEQIRQQPAAGGARKPRRRRGGGGSKGGQASPAAE
ncbi:MAG: polynucleotide adenylyltransferase PcnB [Burkholderiaceae bacterium]